MIRNRWMETAFFKLVLDSPLTETETLERTLSFVATFPQFAPQRIDHGEPPRFRFDATAFPQVFHEADYQRGWLWDRKNPDVRGHRITNSMTFESLTFNLKQCSQDELIDVLKWSIQRPCIFAICQVLSRREVQRLLPRKMASYQGKLSTPEAIRDEFSYGTWWLERSLAYGLPDLPWITVFGPRYVRFFGKEKLLSAPAFRTAEVASDSVLVQLCEDYREIDSNWDRFDATREAVIDHLGREAFSRVRQAEDPPPTWERDALTDVGEANVPPEFIPIRRRDAEIPAKREVLPPALNGLDEMLAHASRFKVAKICDSRVLIDTARREMIGFADPAQADDWIGQLIRAGAQVAASAS